VELHDRIRRVVGAPFVSLHSSEPPNPWAGYKLALERALDLSATHYVVLQDDALPCAGFMQKVHERTSERPGDVVSLWVGGLRNTTTKLYRRAQIAQEHWSMIHFSDIHHCVGLVWPKFLVEEFLDWTEVSMLPGDGRNQQSDDAIIGAWARRTKHVFWATVPSLVEHLDDVDSTINRPRGDAGRRAIAFAG
jgi:hypothetical protein